GQGFPSSHQGRLDHRRSLGFDGAPAEDFFNTADDPNDRRRIGIAFPACKILALNELETERRLSAVNRNRNEDVLVAPLARLLPHPLRLDRDVRPQDQYASSRVQFRGKLVIPLWTGQQCRVPEDLPATSLEHADEWFYPGLVASRVADEDVRHTSLATTSTARGSAALPRYRCGGCTR